MGIATPQSTEVINLLRRCREALAVGAPEWEFDIETAMASDAALVKELDEALGN